MGILKDLGFAALILTTAAEARPTYRAEPTAWEEPWGLDADMIVKTASDKPAPRKGPMVALSGLLIGFHQNVISPCDGPRSHFAPSSSAYTLNAIRKYGFAKGFIMGCDRLMRENSDPWVYPVVTFEDGNSLKEDPA